MVFPFSFFTPKQLYYEEKVLGYGKFSFKEFNILSSFPKGYRGEKKEVGLVIHCD